MPIRLRPDMSHQIINSPADGRGSLKAGGHVRSDSDTSSITEARFSNFSTVELIGTSKLNELVGFYKDQNIRANMQQQADDQSSHTSNYDNQRLSTFSGTNHITIDHHDNANYQPADQDQIIQQGAQLNAPSPASSSSSAAPAAVAAHHNYHSNRVINGNGANGAVVMTDSDRSTRIMPTLSSKRVIVVVDESRESRRAMLWALSHLVQRADILTLLQVLPAINQAPSQGSSSRPTSPPSHHMKEDSTRSPLSDHMKEGGLQFTAPNNGYKSKSKTSELGASLKLMCTSRRPEVEVEVMIVEGIEKGPTIVNQAKKLEASILVLGQRKPSFLQRLFQRTNDPLVEYCIENADCMTLAVRKKNKQAGGYLINSRWQKNFWLLA